MKVAVLTYPGHFFLTQLCVRCLARWDLYSTAELTILYDDLDLDTWVDFAQDLRQTFPRTQFVAYSSLPNIHKVQVGWWRQQLVKLHVDQMLPGDQWFLVDGDVLFDSAIDPRVIPVSRYRSDDVAIMMANYVRDMLGIDQPYITVDRVPCVTSAIPWRLVDRELLQKLRCHVQHRYPGEVVDVHAAWFQDQTIVAGWPAPTKWIMSEWELIENYRFHVMGTDWPLSVLGGYDYDTDLQTVSTFRHGFVKDQELGTEWFQQQDLEIDPALWAKSRYWWENRRP